MRLAIDKAAHIGLSVFVGGFAGIVEKPPEDRLIVFEGCEGVAARPQMGHVVFVCLLPFRGTGPEASYLEVFHVSPQNKLATPPRRNHNSSITPDTKSSLLRYRNRSARFVCAVVR